ncbi:PAS and ANTAR domain-containing protein [Nocardia sp. CA-128927]|uniref:PAS and ANTAR domain-containing protein n=1 Tax=Nocardia sp. CA-128927 TaxID=3239975 RepID=UPI003D996E65
MTEFGQTAPCGADALGQMVAGRPQSVGSFRFWFADQQWEWSDEVAVMHGYRPGSVVLTTELLLSHKHPDDRAHVAAALAMALETGEPFCSRHRIIDTTGVVHSVIVVGDRLLDDAGEVVGTSGFYVDVSDSVEEGRREAIEETLPELIKAREVIEQAKGALMLVYGINAEQAFRVLQWRSQETNTKLRQLAELLVNEITALGGGPLSQRTSFDHLLLTVHEQADPAEEISSLT